MTCGAVFRTLVSMARKKMKCLRSLVDHLYRSQSQDRC